MLNIWRGSSRVRWSTNQTNKHITTSFRLESNESKISQREFKYAWHSVTCCVQAYNITKPRTTPTSVKSEPASAHSCLDSVFSDWEVAILLLLLECFQR